MITPDDLPKWMTGDILENSAELGWLGVKLKRYVTPPQEIWVPGMDEFAIVSYASHNVLAGGIETSAWQTETVHPGTVSVLTMGAESHWRWEKPIDAVHLYFSKDELSTTAAEVFEKDIDLIELRSVRVAEDYVLAEAVTRLVAETGVGGLGGKLYVEAIRCQISVHILRHYANTTFRESSNSRGLSYRQRKLVLDYINENISNQISLNDLAVVLNLSVFHFSRQFRQSFDCAPHAFVMKQRLDHAKQQLRYGQAPLKAVAADCGFADQSHMTRFFKRQLNTTPAVYRLATQGQR